jgi:hypothetical protein
MSVPPEVLPFSLGSFFSFPGALVRLVPLNPYLVFHWRPHAMDTFTTRYLLDGLTRRRMQKHRAPPFGLSETIIVLPLQSTLWRLMR